MRKQFVGVGVSVLVVGGVGLGVAIGHGGGQPAQVVVRQVDANVPATSTAPVVAPSTVAVTATPTVAATTRKAAAVAAQTTQAATKAPDDGAVTPLIQRVDPTGPMQPMFSAPAQPPQQIIPPTPRGVPSASSSDSAS